MNDQLNTKKIYGSADTLVVDSTNVGKRIACVSIQRDLAKIEEHYGVRYSSTAKHLLGASPYVGLLELDQLCMGTASETVNLTEESIEDFIRRDAECYKLTFVELEVVEEHKVATAYDAESDIAARRNQAFITLDVGSGKEFRYEYPRHSGGGEYLRYLCVEIDEAGVDAALQGDDPVYVYPCTNVMRDLQDNLKRFSANDNESRGRHRFDTQASRVIESRLERVAQLMLDNGYGFRYELCFPQYNAETMKVRNKGFRSYDLLKFRTLNLKDNDNEVLA